MVGTVESRVNSVKRDQVRLALGLGRRIGLVFEIGGTALKFLRTLSVFSLAVFGAMPAFGQGPVWERGDSEKPYYVGNPLPVSWEQVGGILAVGYKGGMGLPVEAFERLVLTRKGKSTFVGNLAALKGRVRIRSAKEALQFVRLLTSPRTFNMWPSLGPRRIELTTRKDWTLAFCFGDRDTLRWLGFSGGRSRMGCIDDYEAWAYGGVGAVVMEDVDGYVIRRVLLVDVDGPDAAHALAVVEHVGRAGEFRLVSKTRRPLPKSLGEDWRMMRYE